VVNNLQTNNEETCSLEMPTFQALGLVALSPIMMDALRWAKTYIENTPSFSFAVAQVESHLR